MIDVAIGSCEDARLRFWVGGEVGEGIGDEVANTIFLGEPLFAVIEGSKGNIAQLSIGCVKDGVGFELEQFGFDGFYQQIVEFGGGFFDIFGAIILQSCSKFCD